MERRIALEGIEIAGILSRFNDYLLLIKFRLTSLVIFTTIVGYLLGAVGGFDLFHFLATVIGVFLVVGSANGMNQVLEIDADSRMRRTAGRPLPSGRIRIGEAIFILALMLILGLTLLINFVNTLSALLTGIAFLIYVFIYTPLKRVTSLCTLIGALPGAIPPVIGWVAVRGELSYEAVILFAIQFLWQFPHFWSIALICENDYKRAGFKMLPFSNRKDTALQIAVYSFMLVPMGLISGLFGLVSLYATVGLVLCGAVLFIQSIPLLKTCSIDSARKLMITAEVYLPLILTIMAIDKI